MAPPPREIATDGRIVPIARLGMGGMGEVLLARRTGVLGFEKLIAVKVIRADRAHHAESRRMFTDEARLLARLDHPSIAQVHDLGEHDGVLYLTMEYVAGIALGALLSRRKAPLPPGIAAQIVAAAARAAHAAHELTDLEGEPLGVVHRDLSPQNVMVTFDGRVKVLDFGVAWMRDREAESTDTGAVKGKLAYLAPEQIKAQPVDRRADVYALSIVLHELLTGRRLFGGDSLAAALRRPSVSPPSARQSVVSPELDAIVMSGLERDPAARWPDAQALAKALDQEVHRLGSEPLEAFVARELADMAAENRAFLKRARTAPEAVTLETAPVASGTALMTGASAAPRRRTWRWAAALVLVAVGAAAAPHLAEVELLWGSAREDATARGPAALESTGAPSRVDDLAIETATIATSSTAVESVAAVVGLATDSATSARIEIVTGALSSSSGPDSLAHVSETIEVVVSSTGAEPLAASSPASATGAGPASATGAGPASATGAGPDAAAMPSHGAAAPAPSARPIAQLAAPPGSGGADHAARRASAASRPRTVASAPAPARAAAANAPRNRRGEGALTVIAREGGWILIDGRRAGATPLLHHRLPAGRHIVALRRPGDTRPRWQARATVHEGRHLRLELK